MPIGSYWSLSRVGPKWFDEAPWPIFIIIILQNLHVQRQSLQPYPQPLGKPLRILLHVATLQHQGTSPVSPIGFNGEGVAEFFVGSSGPLERIVAFGLDMVQRD